MYTTMLSKMLQTMFMFYLMAILINLFLFQELTELHHENVVALFDCKETATNVYLVMEVSEYHLINRRKISTNQNYMCHWREKFLDLECADEAAMF